MDVITVLGAMALAYMGMMAIYYRSRSNEKEEKTSELMLKGIRSMRSGNWDRALILKQPMSTVHKITISMELQKLFTILALHIKKKETLIRQLSI